MSIHTILRYTFFFFYRPHDNIGQSRYQHWYWYCWCLNWYALYYAVVALNYWREESVKWTSFVIMYLCQAPGNGVKYSEANSALLIPRDSRQSKSRGEMAAEALAVAVWLCIFQMNNNVVSVWVLAPNVQSRSGCKDDIDHYVRNTWIRVCNDRTYRFNSTPAVYVPLVVVLARIPHHWLPLQSLISFSGGNVSSSSPKSC